ncbi:hypothetical protein LPB72_06420 [Hydrogenophaga crassostreae]|uniref:DUF4149 domain-containing protein n=2 Tax=Hydrogenophaga crassostreae TaxID=1763535 RepID=A0ABX2U9K3_9BURK|nr:hypothetical protein [Hydrogenophaga crassostreae]OAD42904.1 hypothetical protein LPB72_06420 [Hydrogenophaga crassostreae]
MNPSMTANSRATSPAIATRGKPVDPIRWLFVAAVLGFVVGVLFILVQPFFGMDTLTSRHAAAYQQLGGWSATPAMLMAWFAHLAVSVVYGLMGGLVVWAVSRLSIVALWTLVFTWVTTVIAPPANALIVQLVSFQQIDPGKLPALNFNFDEKLALHLVVFAAIIGPLYAYRKMKPVDRSDAL